MAEKTYINHRAGSVAWAHEVEGVVRQDTLPFKEGVLVTADPALQEYIEKLPAFAKESWITLKNDARADLFDNVVLLGNAAKAAEAAAVAAEFAAALPARLRAVAEKAKKDAGAAVAALSDFDKAAAPAAKA